MSKVCAAISYDGTAYHGFQVQPNGLTVQEVIEDGIRKLTGETLRIDSSGRTDAGVHARHQVIHFHTSSPIPLSNWPSALNRYLPDDIVMKKAVEVPESFHARISAKQKTYRYTIRNARIPNVFFRHYEWLVRTPLNWKEMEKALAYFEGTHEFTSFCSANSEALSHVRTVHEAKLTAEPNDPDVHYIWLTGNGFLYNMVRIITGTVVQVGLGKKRADDIPQIIQDKQRESAGPTAPPNGLMLWEVQYDNILI